MAQITLSGNIGHSNPVLSIIDILDAQGGMRTVPTFTNGALTTEFAGIPNKVKQFVSVITVQDTNTIYYLKGLTATDTGSWASLSAPFAIGGTGTVNHLAKFTGTSTVEDSQFYEGIGIYGGGGYTKPSNLWYVEFIPEGNTFLRLRRSQSQMNFTLGDPQSNQISAIDLDNIYGSALRSNAYLQIGASSGIYISSNTTFTKTVTYEMPSTPILATGEIVYFGTTLSALVPGDIYYYGTSGRWEPADINAHGTKILGIPLGATVSAGILIRGFAKFPANSNYTFAQNSQIQYLNSTPGSFSEVAPTVSGDVVRIIGYCVDNDKLYFNPDPTWIKIL